MQSVAVPSRRDLIQLGILSNNSCTVGSAIINLARTSFRMSQQNFQFGKTKSMESSTIIQLLTVIILLSLGWNSKWPPPLTKDWVTIVNGSVASSLYALCYTLRRACVCLRRYIRRQLAPLLGDSYFFLFFPQHSQYQGCY